MCIFSNILFRNPSFEVFVIVFERFVSYDVDRYKVNLHNHYY